MGFEAWHEMNQWSLWGQPIVDLRSGVQRGTEFLLRPASGRSPTDLLRKAAQAGYLSNLEEAIVRRALQTQVPGLRFINVTLPSLLRINLDMDLSGAVLELTEQHQADPDLVRVLRRLRQNGARFALDDVASGWGRLAGLIDWRPEYVKLDWPLIHEVHRDPMRQTVVRAIVQLSRDLGGVVIAEGIEAPEELDYLREHGVPLGQGFLLGSPAQLCEREVAHAACD